MNLDAVRAFVAVADAGRFHDAAADLSITQQAVSKRIAALERDLGVRVLARTAQGSRLTIDGRAFLPHARDLLRAAERAAESVRPGRRALRVDVIGRRLAPAVLLRDFHRAHPGVGVDVDVVTLYDAAEAVEAVQSGTIDASFRAVAMPGLRLPDGVESARVLDEPIQLLTGPDHRLAGVGAVAPADLAGHRIWMPGNEDGTEWAAYYDALAADFGFAVDRVGPGVGTEPLLEVIAGSPDVATLVGELTRLLWPSGYGLRRVPLRGPEPVYPHSLIWRGDNPHPALAALRGHLASHRREVSGAWTPAWATGRWPPDSP